MLRADVELARGSFRLRAAIAVASGEVLALVGPSGAGKSTLLRVLAGLLRADRGMITLDGASWLDTGRGIELPAERRRVGLVFQEYALFPRMPAWRNVAYGIRGAGRGERRRRAHEQLADLGLAARVAARPAELSGGERQRVALARALASEPLLLLLDEPLSALDAATRAAAAAELAQALSASERPAVIVTHDFTEAARLADRIAVLDDGEIVQAGTAAELAARPASAFVADLAGAVVLHGVAVPAAGGLTRVALSGGGEILSTDPGAGPVAASVFPWEIELHAPGGGGADSALNRLAAEVTGVSEFGNRARVALALPQPAVAEVTSASVARLGIAAGVAVEASWKATATRLVAAARAPTRGRGRLVNSSVTLPLRRES